MQMVDQQTSMWIFLSNKFLHVHIFSISDLGEAVCYNQTRMTAGTVENPAPQQTTCDIQIGKYY